ncbi:hypothetical protein BDQ12DRAFT_725424 [Crucibulum laeve]|uniref:Uncharacterized protein n=1 Tax=Crucibulum laeve TaxID=68775 RepID=A0A5C3LSL8_9AGAR|nr:hypothetical protein BDQ12DRAFT_725424 [Crucibulum laeve]
MTITTFTITTFTITTFAITVITITTSMPATTPPPPPSHQHRLQHSQHPHHHLMPALATVQAQLPTTSIFNAITMSLRQVSQDNRCLLTPPLPSMSARSTPYYHVNTSVDTSVSVAAHSSPPVMPAAQHSYHNLSKVSIYVDVIHIFHM